MSASMRGFLNHKKWKILLCNHRKCVSGSPIKTFHESSSFGGGGRENTDSPLTYREFLNSRLEEAERTVIIKLKPQINMSSVYESLESRGEIANAIHFKEYLMVEFKNKNIVQGVISDIGGYDLKTSCVVESRLLQYTGKDDIKRNNNLPKSKTFLIDDDSELHASKLQNMDSISHQMLHLHDKQQMSEVGIRLRFLTCLTIKDFLSGVLPHCKIEPYGSCVNGFGSRTSDLDMAIDFPSNNKVEDSVFDHMFTNDNYNENGRLNFISKMMTRFFPSVYKVFHVRNARVPIIKFNLKITDLSCDLSFSNLSGCRMSELLYLFSHLDPRIPPLASTVKVWALENNMTKKVSPGPWPTNFILLIMVIFFFQSKPKPTLPSLLSMKQFIDGDILSSKQVQFPSLLKLQTLVKRDHSNESLDELLKEFFEYYTKFDFQKQGISLISGQSVLHSTKKLYIENPFEAGHNMAKNVSVPYIDKLNFHMEMALRTLESSDTSSKQWGIIPLVCRHDDSGLPKFKMTSLFTETSESSDAKDKLNNELKNSKMAVK